MTSPCSFRYGARQTVPVACKNPTEKGNEGENGGRLPRYQHYLWTTRSWSAMSSTAAHRVCVTDDYQNVSSTV